MKRFPIRRTWPGALLLVPATASAAEGGVTSLIDPAQVLTQILGFLIMLWILRKYAWGPLLGTIEGRRQRIAGEFQEAERRRGEAEALRGQYEQQLRGIEAQARQRIQEAVAEGQKVAAEIKAGAHHEAHAILQRAQEETERDREKAKEILKHQIVELSIRSTEKILRRELDETAQRRLAAEFIDEVGAIS